MSTIRAFRYAARRAVYYYMIVAGLLLVSVTAIQAVPV